MMLFAHLKVVPYRGIRVTKKLSSLMKDNIILMSDIASNAKKFNINNYK